MVGPKVERQQLFVGLLLCADLGDLAPSIGESVMLCSRRRYSEGCRARPPLGAASTALPPVAVCSLKVNLTGFLAADGEVTPQRMALVVLWHQDVAQVGVTSGGAMTPNMS